VRDGHTTTAYVLSWHSMVKIVDLRLLALIQFSWRFSFAELAEQPGVTPEEKTG